MSEERKNRPPEVETLHGLSFDLEEWITNHMSAAMGSVGNKEVFRNSDFIFQIIKGPNYRNDFHVDPYDEIFYQLKGTAYVEHVDEQGRHHVAEIREGEVLLIKAFAPHSPQRPPDTVGLVVERPRVEGELDGLLWFCDNCGQKLHETWMQCDDIAVRLKEVLDAFNNDLQARTCGHCSVVLPDPRQTPPWAHKDWARK